MDLLAKQRQMRIVDQFLCEPVELISKSFGRPTRGDVGFLFQL